MGKKCMLFSFKQAILQLLKKLCTSKKHLEDQFHFKKKTLNLYQKVKAIEFQILEESGIATPQGAASGNYKAVPLHTTKCSYSHKLIM